MMVSNLIAKSEFRNFIDLVQPVTDLELNRILLVGLIKLINVYSLIYLIGI